jgi:hypothetical protein
MEEFNEYYALAQKMLGDEKVSTLVAVFEVAKSSCVIEINCTTNLPSIAMH